MNELKIILGNEFQIKVEKINEFDKSFFKDIYRNAAKCVDEIIQNTNDYNQLKRTKKYNKDKEEYNNIIAFIGERGTGKSSAMISFAESLKEINRINQKNEFSVPEMFNKIKEYQYVNLDIIDPSLFEDKESIFEIIIAKMFDKFKKYLESKDADIDIEDKRKILKSFQHVYESLRILNMDRKDLFKEDGYSETILETLSKLASSSNMRDSFINLVNKFLGVMSSDNDSNDKSDRFLVIAIDDLDMNIRNSAEMVEQIRKYLLVPNVIVLMAVKIEQLSYSLEQSYRKNYRLLLDTTRNNYDTLISETKSMAYRYIEKLIPNGRKLYLPAIRTPRVEGKETILKLVDKNRKEIFEKDKGSIKYTIEEKVLQMTYKKTGLIFIKPEYDFHYLVPDNLRELQNYLTILSKLSDINDEIDNEKKLYNVEKFEEYFLNTWVRSKLEPNNISLINEINMIHINLRNKYVINFLIENVLQKNSNEMISGLENIIKRSNNPLNVSIGDVIAVFKYVENYDDKLETKRLLFAIKTLYSITMYKLKLNNNLNSLSKILGGNIFNSLKSSDFFDIDIKHYDEIKINNYYIGEVINNIIADIKEQINSNNNELKNETIKNIQLVEWLHYFVFLGKIDKNFRELSNIYYERKANYQEVTKNITGKIKNARFNILSLIFNFIEPENILKRIYSNSLNFGTDINNGIFDLIKNNSIYGNYSKNNNDNDYFFVLPVYNFEFLEILSDKLLDKIDLKDKDKRVQYFKNFFHVVNKAIKSLMNDIFDNNIYLNKSLTNIIESYNKNPIINFVFEEGFQPNYILFKKVEVINLLNTIYHYNKDNTINIKELKSNFKTYFEARVLNMKPKTQIGDKLNELISFSNLYSINELIKSFSLIKQKYDDDLSRAFKSEDIVDVKINISKEIVRIIDGYLEENGE